MDRFEVGEPHMTCTRCFRDAGPAPHYADIDGDLLCLIATGWLCSECLDAEELTTPTPETNEEERI